MYVLVTCYSVIWSLPCHQTLRSSDLTHTSFAQDPAWKINVLYVKHFFCHLLPTHPCNTSHTQSYTHQLCTGPGLEGTCSVWETLFLSCSTLPAMKSFTHSVLQTPALHRTLLGRYMFCMGSTFSVMFCTATHEMLHTFSLTNTSFSQDLAWKIHVL